MNATDTYKFNHKGIRFNVEVLPNAMIDMNGRKLFQIDVEDMGQYNERGYNIELVTKVVRHTIENNI